MDQLDPEDEGHPDHGGKADPDEAQAKAPEKEQMGKAEEHRDYRRDEDWPDVAQDLRHDQEEADAKPVRDLRRHDLLELLVERHAQLACVRLRRVVLDLSICPFAERHGVGVGWAVSDANGVVLVQPELVLAHVHVRLMCHPLVRAAHVALAVREPEVGVEVAVDRAVGEHEDEEAHGDEKDPETALVCSTSVTVQWGRALVRMRPDLVLVFLVTCDQSPLVFFVLRVRHWPPSA
mmetsp:Transcript_55246/g.171144  ORF Transcript_55246/g.171144 Transcript_55246/m.171144 type:complete len:235 (-) Transcript_55246:41-745(-)